MSQVGEWLQRIITVVILAGFLEMLLPNNELKNITKMIMGLLIIILLIQPLVKLFDLPQRVIWSLSGISENKVYPSTGQIIQQGLKLRDSWNIQWSKENKRVLEGKIKNIIGLIDEVNLKDILLQYKDSKLSKAILSIVPSRGSFFDDVTRKKITRKMINSVQLLTNLAEDQIEVIWNGRKK